MFHHRLIGNGYPMATLLCCDACWKRDPYHIKPSNRSKYASQKPKAFIETPGRLSQSPRQDTKLNGPQNQTWAKIYINLHPYQPIKYPAREKIGLGAIKIMHNQKLLSHWQVDVATNKFEACLNSLLSFN